MNNLCEVLQGMEIFEGDWRQVEKGCCTIIPLIIKNLKKSWIRILSEKNLTDFLRQIARMSCENFNKRLRTRKVLRAQALAVGIC